MKDMEYAISFRYSDGHGRLHELPKGTTRTHANAERTRYLEEALSGSRHTIACGATEVILLEREPGEWRVSR